MKETIKIVEADEIENKKNGEKISQTAGSLENAPNLQHHRKKKDTNLQFIKKQGISMQNLQASKAQQKEL